MICLNCGKEVKMEDSVYLRCEYCRFSWRPEWVSETRNLYPLVWCENGKGISGWTHARFGCLAVFGEKAVE